MIHSPSERNSRYYAGPKPGASSGSPTQVQGPKALGWPQLLSWATGRELEGKLGCRDRTGTHMGSRVCKARTLTTCATALDPRHQMFYIPRLLVALILPETYWTLGLCATRTYFDLYDTTVGIVSCGTVQSSKLGEFSWVQHMHSYCCPMQS